MRKLKTLGRDADDCVALTIERHRFSDHARLARESPLPQRVAYDDDLARARVFFIVTKRTTELWFRTHQPEEARRDTRTADSFRFARARHVPSPDAQRGDIFKNTVLLSPIHEA